MAKTFIGAGLFSRAWRLPSGEVEVVSECPAKECMSLGWFPDHRLFPKIERVDIRTDGFSVYRMPYYSQPRSLKGSVSPRQWRLYRALRGVYPGMDSFTLKENLASLPGEFRAEKQALIEAVEAMENYGSDVGFEISPQCSGEGRQVDSLGLLFHEVEMPGGAGKALDKAGTALSIAPTQPDTVLQNT